MKKILSIFAVACVATVGYSQGSVSTGNNAAAYAISTNGVTLGKTFGTSQDPGGQSYAYQLLYSATSTAAVGSGSSANTISAWSLGPTMTEGIGAGGITGAASASMGAANTTYYIELVGWSTGLGTTFASIESTIEAGDTSSIAGQFLGFSNVGQVTTATSPAPGTTIFSAGAIPSGFDLNPVTVPEPTSIALAAMGGLSLLALRRKKA